MQYPNLLGRGACKKVFRAIDCELGIEVAWNQVIANAWGVKPGSIYPSRRVLETL